MPLALLLSAYVPWLIVPILLIGGAYLSFEGVEKIYHFFTHQKQHEVAAKSAATKEELLKIEKDKIRSAVRTDFILSIEIVMIALGTVMEQALVVRVMVVSLIALLATVGVYGVVALIVRMDDMGFALILYAKRLSGAGAGLLNWTGAALVAMLPRVIRALAVIGTIAMLLVGGGMFTHNIDALHHAFDMLPLFIVNLGIGLVVGTVLLALMKLAARMHSGKTAQP